MSLPEKTESALFTHSMLPVVNKPVLRMGVAGNYGIDSSDICWAADQGVNYWVWGYSYGRVTDGIREVIRRDRDHHVVAMLGWGLAGWQVRFSVEQALRKLNTDYLDIFKLGWLGRTSAHSSCVMNELDRLKQEGKIKAIGTSIHDRIRAGILVRKSNIDIFMIRYNAKHPGAEQDIFPHLGHRNPGIVSYTALAWGQLVKPVPVRKTRMPQWPGMAPETIPPLTPELCYRFVLSNPKVNLVLSGPANRRQLRENLTALTRGPLETEELKWIRDYGQHLRSVRRFDYI